MRKLILVLLFSLPAFGQVTVSPFLSPAVQFLDNTGRPLNGGKVCFFAAGSTTPQTAYSDNLGTVPLSNPLVLDSAGRGTIFLTAQSYKIVIAASTASSQCVPALQTADNVTWSTIASTVASLISTGNVSIQQSAAATVGANQSSPTDCIQGNYWTGAASAADKWCWQDVLGTGSNPTSTLTSTHTGSSGTKTVSLPSLSVTGGSTQQSVNGIQFAATYAGSSTTCGIAEAYAALPANGGKIILQLGNCSASGWPVTITKPVVIEGQGMGGPNDAGTNAAVVAGSSLTNTSTGNSFFILSLPAGASASVEGITFRDFAMIGNKAIGGATAGDCVDVNGGTASQQLRAISFENIQCNQPKGSGFVIQDNAFVINFRNVQTVQTGSHCYVLKDGTHAGVNSQIHFMQSTADLCGGNNASFLPGTADGWNISGASARDLEISHSTLADSNNGINVVAGAVNSNVYITGSNLESNTTCDISLNDGLGHTIIGNTLRGDSVGARGICTAMPVGAAVQGIQLIMLGNLLAGHTAQDVTIGANQKTGILLPQATNNYSYSDASGKVVAVDVNTGGAITFRAVEVMPLANGSTQLGDSAFSWSTLFTYIMNINETTAPAGVAGRTIVWDDSTAHRWKMNNNNGGAVTVAATSGDTFTTTTLTSPTINGTPTGTGISTVTLKSGTGAGNYQSASTTYVRPDSTNLAYTVTIPTGWKLVCHASGTALTITGIVQFGIALADGSADNTGILVETQPIASNLTIGIPFALDWVVNGDGASHTINLQYKTTNGADSVLIANGTSTFKPTMTFLLTPSN